MVNNEIWGSNDQHSNDVAATLKLFSDTFLSFASIMSD